MKKVIGILSDTHSCWDERFRTHLTGCDEIWHAGDIGDPSILDSLSEIAPVRAVCGNIDHGEVRRRCPEVLDFSIDGLHVWMTHIAGYPGRYSPGVAKILKEGEVGLMVCGHSHILKVIHDDRLGLLHINPGAAGWHGWQKERTLVRLTLNDGVPSELEVINLGKPIKNY